MVLFAMASVEAVTPWIQRRWPDATVVCDPEAAILQRLGTRRMRGWQLLSPKIWWRAIRATLRGHLLGSPRGGDVWILGAGLLLASEGAVLWHHRSSDPSDIVRPDAVMAAVHPG